MGTGVYFFWMFNIVRGVIVLYTCMDVILFKFRSFFGKWGLYFYFIDEVFEFNRNKVIS